MFTRFKQRGAHLNSVGNNLLPTEFKLAKRIDAANSNAYNA